MKAYEPFIYLGPLSHRQKFVRQFPIRLPAVSARGEITEEISINTYRQLYDFMDGNKDLALYHFQVLHGKIAPNRVDGEYNPTA